MKIQENVKKANNRYIGKYHISNHNIKSSGITLIALIVTIIIMLILSVVSVQLAVNRGLFEKTKNAVNKTEEAYGEEQNYGEETIQNEVDKALGRTVKKGHPCMLEASKGEEITTEYMGTTGELSTGATVYYKLSEPNTTETIELPQIPTFVGTTILTSTDRYLEASKIHAKY